MKRWHALAACVAAVLALLWFRASGPPVRAVPRSFPRTEEAIHDRPEEPPPGPAEVTPPRPAPAPEAPSTPTPTKAIVVAELPALDGKDVTETWVRVTAVDLTDAEKATVDRHLTRFVRQAPPAARDPGEERVDLLPKADPDAAEKRRVEQLELLRQRKAIKLLDHIGQGLAWLALHQGPDGKISDTAAAARCAELGHDPACVEAVGGQLPDEWTATAATALAIMALLDFRDQDKQGLFEPTLARAVKWLRAQQQEDGMFRSAPKGSQYATAIALIALGQAAAASGGDDLRKAVHRGLQGLSLHQGADGGYRYRPLDPGDLSVVAWVAQAVEAARRAEVEIPQAMQDGLPGFLNAVWLGDERFLYTVGGQDRPSLYPAGMLAGLILWKEPAPDTLETWRAWLKRRPPGEIYSFYYGVRVAIALDGGLADPWREAILSLAGRQQQQGPRAGLFGGELDRWLRQGGIVVQTAFAVLTMEHALYSR
jgi:hypothetical protein